MGEETQQKIGTLIVEPYRAYGKDQFRPCCPLSILYARLLKQKYLTREDIEGIKEIGHTVRLKEGEL